MSHKRLKDRFESFDWHVISVNGNDYEELNSAFEEAKTVKHKPTCIIANTIKGFGGGELMENKAGWHHHVPTEEEYRVIKEELLKRKEAACNE